MLNWIDVSAGLVLLMLLVRIIAGGELKGLYLCMYLVLAQTQMARAARSWPSNEWKTIIISNLRKKKRNRMMYSCRNCLN